MVIWKSKLATVVVYSVGVVTLLPASSGATERHGPSKVLAVLGEIQRNLRVSRYQHGTVVRQNRGEYYFDCSGMAHWVLRRASPQALRQIGQPRGRRPLAMDYHRHISRIPPGRRRGAWYHVPGAGSSEPGDIVAWRRPPWFRSKSTGHVAFVMSHPQPNYGGTQGYLMRVADASRYRHQDDTRQQGQTGFGTGILLVVTDHMGRPAGYGWAGAMTPPEWIVPAEVVIGRPLR